ncbi:MAG TPA: hypothetical protein VHZ02_06955 [Acidimicrobiales bacterium]|nr:hypothetical protein [Acidimicrobiales bacterium]
MTDTRRVLSWLLLALVGVVTAGGAFLGVYYAPSQPVTSLKLAAKSTGAASSYTEDLKQKSTTNGVGQLHLVLQAPDRAVGFQQATGQRLYFVIVNDTVYQTTPTKISSSVTVHHFTVQHATNPIPQVDPLPSYLTLVSRAKDIHHDGAVYTFPLATNTGGKALLHYTVTGEYVSKIVVDIAGSVTTINVTKINSSPPIKVPAKSSIVSGTTPTTTTP